MRLLKGFTTVGLASSLVMFGPAAVAQAEEVVTVFRCQMALYDVLPQGRDANCKYTAGSLEGLAIVTIETGAIDLYVDCTLGGFYETNIRRSKQISYANGGSCFAAIFPRGREGELTFAVVDVGSVSPV
jgi:hypothetical protein